MKLLTARRALGALLLALAIPAVLLALASLPWRGEREPSPPRVVASGRCSGPLRAGAAEVRFALPPDVPIAGYARRSYRSEAPAGPVGARALVLAAPGCAVAVASAEILLVPETLDAAVRARVADLGLSGILLAATHTHSGPGGFWRHPVGERIATGPYDPRLEDAIVTAIAEAIRAAAASLSPARVSVGRGAADDLARSRSGGLEDAPLTVVRVERSGGAPLAELTVFAAHATVAGRASRAISGDWPGRFLEVGGRGLRLFVQGAVGDQSTEGPASGTVESYARAVSARVEALRLEPPDPAPGLAFAAVEVALPAPEPGAVPALLRRAARTLAFEALPATARVEAIRLGRTLLVGVPGEPVASVGAAWRRALAEEAAIVSIAGGYVGYVEDPGRMAERAGETPRTYYGPELADRLGAAIRIAAEATRPAPR